tara:strand:+ start:944 stop:1693 length:750 start_codon:yes stop_codon:yes gene_type:complete
MTIYDKIFNKIPQQFRESENFNKILQVFTTECDELLKVFEDLKIAFLINSAVGDQLDIIGAIVVIARDGRADEQYREAIKFKIFLNTSNGRVEEIILILKTITEATKIVYSDHPPASYTIYTDGSKIDGNLNILIDRLTGAGISVTVEMGLGDPPLVFPNIEPIYNNLIDNNSNNIVTDIGLQIIVNINNAIGDGLLELYNGEGMGTIATNNLTDNLGNFIVTNEGKRIVVTDLNGDSEDKGGYLPITF